MNHFQKNCNISIENFEQQLFDAIVKNPPANLLKYKNLKILSLSSIHFQELSLSKVEFKVKGMFRLRFEYQKAENRTENNLEFTFHTVLNNALQIADCQIHSR